MNALQKKSENNTTNKTNNSQHDQAAWGCSGTFYQKNIWEYLSYSINGLQKHENSITTNNSLHDDPTWYCSGF
jgi:hypothetical protein